MKKGLLLFVLVFTLMGCGETKSTEIESSVELKESEEKQESAQKFEMTEDADEFLQRMCFYLPDFSSDEDMDEEFWHQFLFYSYTGQTDVEMIMVTNVPGSMLGQEMQVKVSREAVAEYVKLVLGVDFPAFEPAAEDMREGQTGFYYKDGYYYIGVSDAPWQHYEYQGCSETADGTITAEYALYYADDSAPSASIFFTLIAFDNENGFIVIKKETEENLFQEYDIKNQTFDVELDDWGTVTFVSIAPHDDIQDVTFILEKDGQLVYTFPEQIRTGFQNVEAVSFADYNEDGKKDVIVIVQRKESGSTWNEAIIFLQENSDNMFYIDFPDMKSYVRETKADEGPSFYRDLFLEEYLSKQMLADSVGTVMGSWSDFAEHVANLNGIYSIDRQLGLFAMQTAVWAPEVEYANEEYCFTVAELDNDGKLDLIVSNCGGTGWFTYSHFYEIDEHGKVRELESDFVEGDSQPDLIDGEMTVYSTFSAEGMCQYFITGDYMKVSPREYYADVRALSMKDDKVEQILLAMEREIYDEDGHGTIMWLDADGNEISAEKYQNAAADYFAPLGYEKKTATFAWKDVAALQGLAEKEIVQLLKESYEGFSVQ